MKNLPNIIKLLRKKKNLKTIILFGTTFNMVSYNTTKDLYIYFKWQKFSLDFPGY